MRSSFNGGLLGRGMALRVDTDIHARGLTACSNFELDAMGGARRRRGWSVFSSAADASSRLFSYIYSDSIAVLVEIGETCLRVFARDGSLMAELLGTPWAASQLGELRATQVKKMLLITHPRHAPQCLMPATDMLNEWSLDPYEFKTPPWRHSELRDQKAMLLPIASVGNYAYKLSFSEAIEESYAKGDLLRVTRQVPSQLHHIPGHMPGGYYPSEEGVACGGKWQMYVAGTRGARLTMQRRYPKGDWHDVGTTRSTTINPINEVLTGDNTDAECYMRVLVTDLSGTWSSWVQQLIIDGYAREMRLEVVEDAQEWIEYARYNVSAFARSVWAPGTYKAQIVQGDVSYETSALLDSDLKVAVKGHRLIDWSAPVDVHLWQPAFSFSALLNVFPVKKFWGQKGMIIAPVYWDGNWFLEVAKANHDDSSFTLLAHYWQGPHRPANYKLASDGYLVVTAGVASVAQGWAVLCENNTASSLAFLGGEGAVVKLLNDIQDPNFIEQLSSADWSLAAFNDCYGYPSVCGVHQQRLFFACTSAQPQSIWMSKSDDINNFSTGLLDDAALALTLATTNESSILWAAGKGQDLIVGTSSGEFVISSSEGVLTASNATAYADGYVGSSSLTPALTALDQVLYMERGAGRLRQLGFNEQANGYVSQDLSVYNPDILEDAGGVVSLASEAKPEVSIYCVLADGTLAAMTYNPAHAVAAWYKLSSPNCKVLDVATLPHGTKSDLVYLRTQRSSPDGTHVQHLIELYSDGNPYADAAITDDGELSTQDYSSTLITTDINIGRTGKQALTGAMSFYMEADVSAAGVEVTADAGLSWAAPNTAAGLLNAGWNDATAPTSHRHERNYGFRVTGARGFEVLGLNISPS